MAVPNSFIQLTPCREMYGAPGTASTTLTRDREQALQRLDINLNSWDAFLIAGVQSIANSLFSTEQEVAWWGNWAVSLAVDLVDDLIPKPIGTLIKAFASAGEHIAGQSIADARTRLGTAGTAAVITYRTAQRTEGAAYIRNYYERIRSRDEECEGYHQMNLDTINQAWPMLDATHLPQAQRLAQQLMEAVRNAELVDQLRRAYEDCVRMELYRPGGIATAEEETRARADCRTRTGYSPIAPC